jgi:hypothetical protein
MISKIASLGDVHVYSRLHCFVPEQASILAIHRTLNFCEHLCECFIFVLRTDGDHHQGQETEIAQQI